MDEETQKSEEIEIVSTRTELPNVLRDTSGESDPSSTTPSQFVTSEECSNSVVVGSAASLDSEAQSLLTVTLEQQAAAEPTSLVDESLRAVSPTQEKSGMGARNETTVSVSGANLSLQWRTLCKESEQLSEKLSSFVNRLNRINGSRDTSQLQSDETVAKEKEGMEMLNAVINEAVQTFQNFSSHFNEMDDKMKQWDPATAAAQENEGVRLLSTVIQQQAEKIEQDLRTQLDKITAENEQLRTDYEVQLKRKDDDLAKLQENLTWKSDAEECKKQIDMYKQEAEEYKRKLENLDKIAQRLEQENKSYQENEEQSKETIQHLQEEKATNEEIIKKQNDLIKAKGNEVETLTNQLNIIFAEVKKLEEDVKQKEEDIQKMQQEIDKKKGEIELQIGQSTENSKLQTEMRDLHGESMYWKGRYEGLHENQQSVNHCVSAISDMGKMAMKKLPDAAETPVTTSPESSTQITPVNNSSSTAE